MFTPAFWRKWHRWIGFPAALFLIHQAGTGLALAFTEFFREEETLREATRDLVVSSFWASSPAVLTVTGLIIYVKMQPRRTAGIQKVFW